MKSRKKLMHYANGTGSIFTSSAEQRAMADAANTRVDEYNREMNRAATLGNMGGRPSPTSSPTRTSPPDTTLAAPSTLETARSNRRALKEITAYNKGGVVKKGLRGAC